MTLVRPLVAEARVYALGYVLVTTIVVVATTPPSSFAATVLVLGACYGLIVAWLGQRKTLRRELTPIARDRHLRPART